MIYSLSSPTALVYGGHNAFPGAVRLASGRIVVAYRAGSAHVSGTPGVVNMVHTDDQGATWSTPVTVLSEPGIDLRDPSLSRLRDGRLAMTLFRYSGGSLGANVCYSSDGGATWTTPAELPVGFTDWSAIAAPVVEPTTGTLMVFSYGQDIGDTFHSVRSLTSTDNGATWGAGALLMDGPADATSYQEPFGGVLADGRVMVDIRSDTDSTRRRIIRSTSGEWAAPVTVSTGVSGRPAWFESSQGHIILGDRVMGGGKGIITAQEDVTSPLSPWTNLIGSTEHLGTYQAMVELGEGVIGVALSYERNDNTDSLLSWATYTPDTYTPPLRRRGASVGAFL